MSAYIMAGIAISPLLNMKGDDAMAIACAAFCIPTSMTMVLPALGLSRPMRVRPRLHTIEIKRSSVHAVPNVAMLSIISRGYCKKNVDARIINAGNAPLLRILFTFADFDGEKCRNAIPHISGTKSNAMFCTNSLPIGKSISVPDWCEMN